jgi:hypothetical protein
LARRPRQRGCGVVPATLTELEPLRRRISPFEPEFVALAGGHRKELPGLNAGSDSPTVPDDNDGPVG